MTRQRPPRRQPPEDRGTTASRIGSEFMEKTRYQYLQVSDQRRGLPQPPLQVPPGPDATRIALPAPAEIEVAPTDLRAAIEGRVSVRRYLDEPLSLEELSWLLWCTQGVKRVEGSYATIAPCPRRAPATPWRPICWSTGCRGWSRAYTAFWRWSTNWSSCAPEER